MEKKWWTLLVVCAATFMLLLDVTIVIVALPEIQRGLHASFSDVQWVVDAYALTLASLLLTAGTLADRYGRRLLFIIGLSVFTLGSLLCGFAQSPLMLTLSRMAQGVGGAILFATSLALLAHSFRGKDRGVAFGVWGAITGVAVALGPILGGVITTGISWRGIFLVNIPFGIAAIIITIMRVDESRTPQASRPDWAGFAVLTIGLVSLVYGLIRASETTWGNEGVVVCLAVAAVLFVTFVLVERYSAHPMFDLGLFRTPTFSGGLAAAFAMNGSLFAVLLYIVLYLQNDLGYSALATGARLLVTSGGTLVAATIAGRLSSRMPVRWLIGPGLALVGVGLFLMSGIHASTPWTHLISGFIVAGVGSGMVNPPLASTAVGVVTPDRSGMASGVNTTFRQIGIAVGIAVYATIFSTELQKGLGRSLNHIKAVGNTAVSWNLRQVVTLVKEGQAAQVIKSTPPALRPQLVRALQSSFTGALNDLFVVSGTLALVGAVVAMIFIRPRDFVAQQQVEPAP
ncbi:MAG: putative integral rane efflux protein [Acidimicrobiaceae bacterium]|nr:putative integral rane efflux protein [Acidimicrobiaceae bacterium]